MKRRYIIGILIIVFMLSTFTGFAKEGKEKIEVFFRNIRIFVNNRELNLENEAFIYNNSTYIPLRAVSEALNCIVNWNEDTNEISISSFRDIKETDPLAGERFVYGEILNIDMKNKALHIYQHIDDNSIDEEPNLPIADDVVIILQRNDKRINLDLEDIRIGDIAGMVLNKDGKIRGIIIE